MEAARVEPSSIAIQLSPGGWVRAEFVRNFRRLWGVLRRKPAGGSSPLRLRVHFRSFRWAYSALSKRLSAPLRRGLVRCRANLAHSADFRAFTRLFAPPPCFRRWLFASRRPLKYPILPTTATLPASLLGRRSISAFRDSRRITDSTAISRLDLDQVWLPDKSGQAVSATERIIQQPPRPGTHHRTMQLVSFLFQALADRLTPLPVLLPVAATPVQARFAAPAASAFCKVGRGALVLGRVTVLRATGAPAQSRLTIPHEERNHRQREQGSLAHRHRGGWRARRTLRRTS